MRAAYLLSMVVLVTGCVSEPLPEPAAPLLGSEDIAPAIQEPLPDSEPSREHHVIWFDTGQKAEEGWIVDGQRHGPWQTWYPTGRKKWEGQYDRGNRVGLWKYWKQNGSPESQESFVDGELSMARRFRGMRLSSEEHYLNGVREGQWTRISSKGVVTYRHYSNGVSIADPWQSVAVSALGYRLKHAPDAEDRLQAVFDMARHGAESWNVVPDLMKGLFDEDPRVVRESAVVLGIMGVGAREAVGALTELAGHEHRQVAEAAKAALRQIEGGR